MFVNCIFTIGFSLTSLSHLHKLLPYSPTMSQRRNFFAACGVVVLLCMSHAPTAWAGAWTVPRERWYAEYFYRYFGSKKVFDAHRNSGRRPTTGNVRDIRNEWKLEYGLTDWLNVLASVPYISSHYLDDTTDLLRTGVGDIYVRTKLRLIEKPLVGSVQLSWKIPSAYDPLENPIGDGQVDFESRLLFSRAWTFAPYQVPARPPREAAMREAVMEASLRQAEARAEPAMETRYAKVAFVNVEGGFTARNEDPANEFPILFEAGFTPFKRLMLVGSIESVISVKSTHEQTEDFAKWGVRAIVNVWGDGFAAIFRTGGPTVNVEVGYHDVFAGRNTADAFEVFGKIGVFF